MANEGSGSFCDPQPSVYDERIQAVGNEASEGYPYFIETADGQISFERTVGNSMTRIAWCTAFLGMAFVAMRQSALLAATLAAKYSWPLVRPWHGYWDVEHCAVPRWGFAAIALFLAGPILAWMLAGWRYAIRPTISRLALTVLALFAGTFLFYFGYYAFIW